MCPSPLMPPKRTHLADLRPVSLSPQAKAAAQSRSGRGRLGMSPALILGPDHSRLHPGTGAQTTPTLDESLTIFGLNLEKLRKAEVEGQQGPGTSSSVTVSILV